MMDQTDRELAEIMIRQWTENLDWARAQPDRTYAEIALCRERIAWWSRKLYSDGFQQIAGASR
jgi:hypothetical protein